MFSFFKKIVLKIASPLAGDEDTTSRLESIAQIILLIGVMITPIFFIPSLYFPAQIGKTSLFIVFVIASFIIYCAKVLKTGKISIPRDFVTLSAILVMLFTLLSALFSGGVGNSFFTSNMETSSAFVIITLLLSYILTVILFQNKGQVFFAHFLFIALASVVSIFHLSRFVLGPDFLSFGFLSGTISTIIGKWNDLAVFLGAAILLVLSTIDSASLNPKLKKYLYIALFLMIAVVSVVNLPVVWIGLFVFSALLIFYSKMLGKKSGLLKDKSQKKPIASIIVLLISLFFLADSFAGNSIFGFEFRQNTIGSVISEKTQTFNIESRPSWLTTFYVAKNSFKDDAILGVGPSRFINEWLTFKPLAVNESPFWSADFRFGIGFLPTLFIEGGILSLLAWLSFLGFFIFYGLKIMFTETSDKLLRQLFSSIFFTTLFLFAMAIVYIPTLSNILFIFFFMGLGMALSSMEKVTSVRSFSFVSNPKIGFLSALFSFGLIILGTLGILNVGEKAVSVARLQKAIAILNTTGNLEEAEIAMKRSVNIDQNDTSYRLLSEISLVKINRLLSEDSGANREETPVKFQEYFGDAVRYAGSATEVNPFNYLNWLSLGKVYESIVPLKVTGAEGAYGAAKMSYERALSLNPTSPQISLILARFEAVSDNIPLARERISEALSKKRNYTDAVFLLSQIEVTQGNIDKAIESVEEATILSPNEPILFFQLGLLKYNDSDLKGASTAFERAIALNPVYANAKYFLGLAYDRRGLKEDALKQFEEILVTNPDNQELKVIIENIKAGRRALAGIDNPAPEGRSTPPVSDEAEPSEEI